MLQPESTETDKNSNDTFAQILTDIKQVYSLETSSYDTKFFTAEKVQVQVRNFLTAVLAAVYNQTVSVFSKAHFLGNSLFG